MKTLVTVTILVEDMPPDYPESLIYLIGNLGGAVQHIDTAPVRRASSEPDLSRTISLADIEQGLLHAGLSQSAAFAFITALEGFAHESQA